MSCWEQSHSSEGWFFDAQNKCFKCHEENSRKEGYDLDDKVNTMVRFASLPPVLHICLNRYHFDVDPQKEAYYMTELDFPVSGFDLSPFVIPELLQDLRLGISVSSVYDLRFIGRIDVWGKDVERNILSSKEGKMGNLPKNRRYNGIAKSLADDKWYNFDVCEDTTPAPELDGAARMRSRMVTNLVYQRREVADLSGK
jgi:hypothetical protein